MCGIVGFIKKDCLMDIYNGLLMLEYRGYDSVGMAFFEKELTVIKKKGKVETIAPLLLNHSTNVGIGHTRWATHGCPSDCNAHPHSSKNFTIVHNGIIENYKELKKTMPTESFESETDSEVIVKLLEDLCADNILKGLEQLKSKLIGSYALAILCKRTPDKIYLVKKENPLIIGQGDVFNCFASDTPALVKHTNMLYKMEDGDIAELTQNEVCVYENGKAKQISFTKTYLTTSHLNRGSYPSYMLKEINDIPLAMDNTLACLYGKGLNDKTMDALRNTTDICLLGCGTAYHACLWARELFERTLHIPSRCETSGEFRYKTPLIGKSTLVIALSQSGETSDTLGAIKNARKYGCFVIGITNVPLSGITHVSDAVLHTLAGAEIAVAATKSYNTQLCVLRYLCERMAVEKGIKMDSVNRRMLYTAAETVIGKKLYIDSFINRTSFENLFFIGRSIDFANALEGALKVKEIAYIPCDACPAAEIKHGPLAMVSEKTLVVCIITDSSLISKCKNAINEVETRGATVLLISPYMADCSNTIKLPLIEEIMLPSLAAIPLQLLALALAIKKGLDPDKPRNLAKSVTVE